MLFWLTAVDMLLQRKIVLECSRFLRQFYMVKSLVELSSSVVVHSSQHMITCSNMASSHYCTESDVADQKDNILRSAEDEDCQTSAKRLKISDSSLENAVGIKCCGYY